MSSAKIRIAVLGSTGSIGKQTLDIVRRNPDAFEVEALSVQSSIALLSEQIREFKPTRVAIADVEAAQALPSDLGVEVLSGPDAGSELLRVCALDAVVVAVLGFAALHPVLTALKRGLHIALANKEVLVAASSLVQSELAESTSAVVPVDSEHNSLFQCMMGRGRHGLRRAVITASGGPFLDYSLEQLAGVSPEQAASHPNWNMGSKISIDSASLMNKGLEVIETATLFNLSADDIEVLVHPQSVIHGFVEYQEGTSLAALYHPDMRVPIAFALDYIRQVVNGAVETSNSGARYLDLVQCGSLEFFAPDLERFPCLAHAYHALRQGGSAPTNLNAANEVAVEAFCNRQIAFLDIPRVLQRCLEELPVHPVTILDDIRKIDAQARRYASKVIEEIAPVGDFSPKHA